MDVGGEEGEGEEEEEGGEGDGDDVLWVDVLGVAEDEGEEGGKGPGAEEGGPLEEVDEELGGGERGRERRRRRGETYLVVESADALADPCREIRRGREKKGKGRTRTVVVVLEHALERG